MGAAMAADRGLFDQWAAGGYPVRAGGAMPLVKIVLLSA